MDAKAFVDIFPDFRKLW